MVAVASTTMPIGFCSRDPIGYLDGYSLNAAYFVPTGRDPFGLTTLQDAIDSLHRQGIQNPSKQQIFDEWLKLDNSGGSFWKQLPKCPCKIKVKYHTHTDCYGEIWDTHVVGNPDPAKWNDPGVPASAEEKLHPGIAFSMRSKGGPPTNQCTYDSQGNLFTQPPQAGTVDQERPGLPHPLPHYSNDVEPIILAAELDGGCKVEIFNPFSECKLLSPPGPNMMKYYKHRPSWSEDCRKGPQPSYIPNIPIHWWSKRLGGLVATAVR
jgi:hypothetical protein